MTPYRALIEEIASQHGLDSNLVEAVTIAESGGCTDAFRYEPEFFRRYLHDKPAYAHQVPRRISSSYGLLQIMYSTAQQYGFSEEPEELFKPAIGLRYGCQHLAHLLRRFDGDVDRALTAYNAGSPESARGRQYAMKVLKLLETVQAVHAVPA